MNRIHKSRAHSLKFRPSTKCSINMVMKRKYETILKPAYCSGPPSANSYQIYKLQALKNSRGGLYSKLTKLNLWSARHPLMLATGIATVKSGVCDYFAQTGIEGRDWNTFNWSRFSLFALFGFFYCGFVQYGIYNKLYPLIFNNMKKGFMRNTLNTMADMTIHSPLFYFPIFYIFKGFVYEKSVSFEIIKQQLHQYFVVNFKEDMIDLYKVWLPTIAFMFVALPIQYRVPWISTIGIVWAIILSLKRGEADIIAPQQEITEIVSTSSVITEKLNGLTIPTIGNHIAQTPKEQQIQYN